MVLDLDLGNMRSHWSLCGATANYLALFALQGRGQTAAIAASTVFNELLENAVKYSPASIDDLRVTLWLGFDALRLQLVHQVDATQAKLLTEALAAIEDHTMDHLIQVQSQRSGSGLGLAALIKEHGVQLVATTRPTDDEGLLELTLDVHFPVESGDTA